MLPPLPPPPLPATWWTGVGGKERRVKDDRWRNRETDEPTYRQTERLTEGRIVTSNNRQATEDSIG